MSCQNLGNVSQEEIKATTKEPSKRNSGLRWKKGLPKKGKRRKGAEELVK